MLILLAYVLLSMGKLTGQSLAYPVDERVRRGGIRRQRLVARRLAIGGAEHRLAADRKRRFMAAIEAKGSSTSAT